MSALYILSFQLLEKYPEYTGGPKTISRAALGVRRAKAAFLSGCKSPPAILLQPEAIGAVMEVTKWLKPSM